MTLKGRGYWFLVSWFCMGLVGVTSALAQIEVTLEPSKDNTLYEDGSGSVSNGNGSFLFAGTTGQGRVRRALLAFDVAGAIPAGATIESVSLSLNMSRTPSGSQTIAVHRVLADWGEGTSNADANEGQGATATAGDATWVHRFFNTTTWGRAGGEFVSGASATLSVGGTGSYSWTSAQLVADVQGWLDQPSENFGWLLRGNEIGSSTTKRFGSQENSQGPRLTVAYTVPTAVEDEPVPSLMTLSGNYPNPFAQYTVITYDLQAPSRVRLEVFDLLGRHVTTLVEGNQGTGSHTAAFSAGDLPTGLYIYRLTAGGHRQHRLMTLQR